ncbi:hypothetical protein TEA_030013 [Camellia sinensis var. sinensis]|uniref:AAA+ ATPase domain-containing protein n=1 Tax=Camellia sinensis var. sinensis TaxID=542762 RepID=A0A4S4DHV0_CAMSN|nr:hypothetical protein TEA_030013 [Camellia sinensis var. sinensis]
MLKRQLGPVFDFVKLRSPIGRSTVLVSPILNLNLSLAEGGKRRIHITDDLDDVVDDDEDEAWKQWGKKSPPPRAEFDPPPMDFSNMDLPEMQNEMLKRQLAEGGKRRIHITDDLDDVVDDDEDEAWKQWGKKSPPPRAEFDPPPMDFSNMDLPEMQNEMLKRQLAEGGKRRIHITDDLDDVVDDDEDEAWKQWGKKSPPPRAEFDPPPMDFSNMDLPEMQNEMLKRQLGPVFGFVKLRLDVETTRVQQGNLCPTTPSCCCLGCTLGEKVSKSLTEVRRLIEAVKFFSNSMVVENCQLKIVEHIPGPSIIGQSTASKNLIKVMNLLNDDDDGASKIGVWGMGGVGKTTLVKNLNNQLETASAASSLAQPFSIIIWLTVSKELDLKRLQTQLLERLNLVVKAGENMESSASRLHKRLKMEKRFLLILDDVWEAIDLDYLGVPQEQPEFQLGNKVILTSRSLDVCRQMKTDIDVKVDVLSEEESWQLFTQNAGKVATLPHIEPIARKVSKECSGLPLAIIIVGASMRGKTTETLWNDALNALEMSVPSVKGIEDKVYKPLKWSYDSLFFQDMDIKSCFLYCSLYPEDFSIQVRELVQCWIAEGLLVVRKSYEDSMNRGIALVENLKDSCLLEDGIFNHTVKMHDVVRDVAIWIASSSKLYGCKSFVQSGIGLNQISEAELSKSLNRVSFMENKITRLPDCAIRCPKVSSLLLQGNLPLEIVPEGFLLGFPALRVLNLSETRIHTLPLSVIQLRKLKALLLQGCQNLKELPPLGTLHRLQVLDCSSTNLEALPEGMENLTDLRLLDLSETHHLRHIPYGIISQLSRLETIDMTNSFYKWGGKRPKEELEKAPIDELGCLNQLIALYINLNSSYLAFEDLSWIKRLKRFHFVIGHADEKLLVQQKYEEKRVTLCRVDFFGECYWVTQLLENASNLTLDYCQNLEEIPAGLANKCYCFIGLKSLTITDYHGDILPARESCDDQFDLLPNLQELVLNEVSSLRSISELAHLLELRLSKLRKISLSYCSSLEYLVSSSGTLKNLEEVTVSYCRKFAELFENASSSESFEDLPEHATSSQTLVPSCIVPNLRIMKLKNLPELTTLCGQHQSWQHLEILEVINCNQIKKLPFTTQNANAIEEIRGDLQWWNDLEWDEEDTKSSLQQYFNPCCRRSGHVAAPAVTKWLEEFENIKNEVNSVEASVESNGGKCCPTTPSCCLGCTLGVKVDKNLTGVRRLIEAANFPSGMVVENYQVKKVEHIPGPSIAGQSTASKNLMKVMDLLSDDDGASRIGVWGMGGVGKTTLVKNLNNQLETAASSAQPFSIIIWVTVSKELDLKRLQTQLLERLNLVVKAGESMESTASQLHERLQKEKRFLLILDDVWETIDLDYLDTDVEVDVLNEEESWQLFTQNAGKVAGIQHIEPIARKVSGECGGLPLAIIIIGASMRGKTTEALWHDALNALQRSVPRIKGIKDKDFEIEVKELVQCWIAEGLVDDELRNCEDSMNRGIALAENLKDSCLLEEGITMETVKMHDIVRDIALWIASSSSSESDGCNNRSLVQSGIGLNRISMGALSKSLESFLQ